ncbi:MAG: hypothetical protein JW852_07060, partial [Spirochaetales bacterium]|nr:hypothetical protein [Spirochaetales bacterium]
MLERTIVMTNIDEREIEKVFLKLNRLKTAVIDSSSIIYLHKSGFLCHVAAAVELYTIPQVIDETGMEHLSARVVDPPDLPGKTSTDRRLFAAAVSMKKAMISEDRAILLKCDAEGVEYYNAYNMLVMLRLRALIDDTQFFRYEEKLL